MKTQRTFITQMDEIVFEHRNKMYGAYLLRKLYHKHLSRALMMALALLFAGLAYPLVSNYYSHGGARHIGNDGTAELMPLPEPPPEAIPLPPPPVAPIALVEKIRFVAPIVTNGEIDGGDADLLNQDFLNLTTGYVKVDVDPETPVERPPDVIEIEETKPIFTDVQEMPAFPGGDPERQKFLAANIQYPQQAVDAGIQGTVYVQFVIDSKGNITDTKILRGIGGGCDEEALRVVKAMPLWHPGKQNGKPVRVLFNMAVIFKLSA